MTTVAQAKAVGATVTCSVAEVKTGKSGGGSHDGNRHCEGWRTVITVINVAVVLIAVEWIQY